MISNGVGSFVNFLPVLLGVVLLGAALGGSMLSPATRKKVETWFLRPLAVLLLAAGLYWAGHEAWRDVGKHDNLLVALHLALAGVLIWVSVDNLRRLIAAFRPAPTPPAAHEAAP